MSLYSKRKRISSIDGDSSHNQKQAKTVVPKDDDGNESSKHGMNSLLCSRCGLLDLAEILSSDAENKNGVHVMDFGRLRQEELSSVCPLCRLITDTIRFFRQPNSVKNYSVRAYSSMSAIGNLVSRRNIQFMTEVTAQAVLGVVEVESKPDIKRKNAKGAINDKNGTTSTKTLFEPIGFLAPTASYGSLETPSFLGRSVDPLKADLTLVRTWLEFCKKNHRRTCAILDYPRIQNLRVIDCSTRRVTKPSKDFNYAAMSYVWGHKEKSIDKASLRCGENGELPSALPQVVEDAMRATMDLGLQHLWIDRFCIMQDDEADQTTQMSMMHLIYNQADFTIVAAAGSDSSYGLAGTSQPRKMQPRGDLGDMVLASTLTDPHETVHASKWMTRAWVYQEALFSLRRVIFTEEQVYYECNNMHCCEAVSLPLEICHTDDKRRFRTCFRHGVFRGGFGKRRWPLTSHIQKYSEKALTYETDILRGMLGIFKAFESGNMPINQLWGVPIQFDMDVANWKMQERIKTQYITMPWVLCASFAKGLSWNLQQPCRRRANFPSWSWAGWAGPLRDWPTFENYTNMEDPDVKCWVKTVTGKPMELSQMLGCLRDDVLAAECLDLDIEAWCFPIRIVQVIHADMPGELLEQLSDQISLFAVVTTSKNTEVYSPIYLCESGYHEQILTAESGNVTKTCLTLSYTKKSSRSPVVMVIEEMGEKAERIGLVDFSDAWVRRDGRWSRFVLGDQEIQRTLRKFVLR